MDIIGADAVSMHINVGSETEADQLEQFGKISRDCTEWGMPLLAMMYPRGKKIVDPHDPVNVAHAARIGAEIGADVVKTVYTGDPDSFRDVIRGCPVPVIIAGGPKTSTDLELEELQSEEMFSSTKILSDLPKLSAKSFTIEDLLKKLWSS